MAAGVKKALKEIEPRLPEDVAYDVMYDTTVFVEAMIHKVQKTLIEAFVLVGIVVFIFLGSVRATLIPIIAVPVALVGTFAVMLALGFSANTISLLALVLAIGIVVDDAIVVVEAVEHILETEPQLTPAEAAEKAMSQVTAPIIAITLVLLSVFVPTAFIPGITGQLYQQFAVAVSVSMIISAINALSLSPALCALLLRHRGPSARTDRLFPARHRPGRDGYSALVRPLARRALITGALVVAFALAAGWLAKVVPTGFLPEEDQGAFFAEVQLPDAASLNRTTAVVAEVEKMIQDRPWTQSVLTVTGYSLIDGLALPNKALAVVGLKPFDERTDKSLSVFSALAEVNALFRQIAAANVIAFNLPPIAGLGNAAGFELQLQTLSGATPKDLAAVADGLVIAANQNPALANVYTTYGASTPQVYLKLDRERAETLGVSIGDIFSALQTTMGGTYVNDFNRFGRTWQVKVQADATDRKGVAGHLPGAGTHSARRSDPVAHRCRCRADHRARLDHPLQQSALGDDQWRARSRPFVRRGTQCDASRGGRHIAAGVFIRMDRHGIAGEAGRRADRIDPRPGDRLRLSVPRRALRELEHTGRSLAVGRRRSVRGDGGADSCSGSTTTSTPRSASSC